MGAPGEPIKYFVVEKDDRFYAERGRWVGKEHLAAFLRQPDAEKIAKRYGATVSENLGYDAWFKSFEDCHEPEATQALAQAIRFCVADGLSLETVLVAVERAYNAPMTKV